MPPKKDLKCWTREDKRGKSYVTCEEPSKATPKKKVPKTLKIKEKPKPKPKPKTPAKPKAKTPAKPKAKTPAKPKAKLTDADFDRLHDKYTAQGYAKNIAGLLATAEIDGDWEFIKRHTKPKSPEKPAPKKDKFKVGDFVIATVKGFKKTLYIVSKAGTEHLKRQPGKVPRYIINPIRVEPYYKLHIDEKKKIAHYKIAGYNYMVKNWGPGSNKMVAQNRMRMAKGASTISKHLAKLGSKVGKYEDELGRMVLPHVDYVKVYKEIIDKPDPPTHQ